MTMAPEDWRHRRADALVEVVQSMLESVQQVPEASPRDLEETWSLVASRIEERFGLVPRYGAASIGPGTGALGTSSGQVASSASGPSAPPSAPKDLRGESDRARTSDGFAYDSNDTIGFFLGDDSPAPPAPSPAPTPPPQQDSGLEAADTFLDIQAPSDRGAGPAVPPQSAPPVRGEVSEDARRRGTVESLSQDLEQARRHIESLEHENARLVGKALTPPTSQTGLAAAGPPSDAFFDAYLNAFKIAPVESVDPGLRKNAAQQLQRLAKYFEKTRTNLKYLYGERGFNVPIQIPKLSEVLERDLRSGTDLLIHLDFLRRCWQTLFGEVWKGQKKWCEERQALLSPEEIEKEARARGEKAWEVYRDRQRRLDLYSSLMDYLRARIKQTIDQARPS